MAALHCFAPLPVLPAGDEAPAPPCSTPAAREASRFGIHEAAHAVVTRWLGEPVSMIDIIPRGDFGGRVVSVECDDD
jgi:hypothetical protein